MALLVVVFFSRRFIPNYSLYAHEINVMKNDKGLQQLIWTHNMFAALSIAVQDNHKASDT